MKSRREFLKSTGQALVATAAVSSSAILQGCASNRKRNTRSRRQAVVNAFLSLLDGTMRFDVPQLAFCTHDSWCGVVKTGAVAGIEQLHLFYGRVPRLLSGEFLRFELQSRPSPRNEKSATCRVLGNALNVVDLHEGFTGELAFLDTDLLCYHLKLADPRSVSTVKAVLKLPPTEPGYTRTAAFERDRRLLVINMLLPRSDPRDPSPHHPLTLSLLVPEAFEPVALGHTRPIGNRPVEIEAGSALVIEFAARSELLGRSEQTFVVGVGEGETALSMVQKVARLGGTSSTQSKKKSREWVGARLANLNLEAVPAHLRRHYAIAVYQILSNNKAPRGRLRRYAAYPSRGKYCSHYLWDSCFTSIGVAQFNERLAYDYLLNLCENQESDGKIPQFICSAWNRPGEAESPLLGWASWRLFERFGSEKFIGEIYGPLGRVVDWWFSARDTDKDGIIEYEGPLEAGWDDSPRFKRGRIAGPDLNAYINREMLVLSRIAGLLGKPAESKKWLQRRSEHTNRMFQRLFDPERGLFVDRLVGANQLSPIVTPASFAPLWTGVPMDPVLAREMISKYLINPRYFFGNYPFPVMAYNEPAYRPGVWWCGPVWLNIAWEMTEVLRTYGFAKEHKEAVQRLVGMITRSDAMAELYHSQTGEPMGCFGYDWTCAMFMDWATQAAPEWQHPHAQILVRDKV